jgi:hypothetical protein
MSRFYASQRAWLDTDVRVDWDGISGVGSSIHWSLHGGILLRPQGQVAALSSLVSLGIFKDRLVPGRG